MKRETSPNTGLMAHLVPLNASHFGNNRPDCSIKLFSCHADCPLAAHSLARFTISSIHPGTRIRER